MNRRVALSAMPIFFLVLVSFPNAVCASDEERVIATVGIVDVTADEDGSIIAVRLVTEDAVRRVSDQNAFYNIFLDEMGMKLGQEMAGEAVQVMGTVYESESELWMAVHWYQKLGGEDEQ